MPASTFQLMHDHVLSIYRALTGNDLPTPDAAAASSERVSAETVAQRFSDLEGLARTIGAVAERVPPFSFAPLLDAFGSDRDLIVELDLPGIGRDEVAAELEGDTLVVHGSRSRGAVVNGHTYFHAEIPRGPFRRVVRLPHGVSGEPRVELDGGIVRIRLSRPSKASVPKA
jgi:HSP20 family molecular chaperone IbpA